MGYLYENSNAERFQHLCQSLLSSDYQALQCFPVGQPDGGRDGWDSESRTVLQVKFKRTDDEENAEWIIESLEKELPKIQKLASRGAEKYIIATNARGTAHQDAGRIDKVQKWLDENLPIPGICFWRDEIDRRLDKASASLKLKYSELLSLEDGLEIALGAALGNEHERQQDAIQAFIVNQFEADRTVKFKQVSLSNDLLDLFIDVPIGFSLRLTENPGKNSAAESARSYLSAMSRSDRRLLFNSSYGQEEVLVAGKGNSVGRNSLGAAELLLSSEAQEHLNLVVLEGAPGQGKSTMAQFVCQMHRARYLNDHQVLNMSPSAVRTTPFRVPIKVDLRDYAAFLDGNSPFSTDNSPKEPLSLDVFLAQLISFGSGGVPFNAYDVLSILKNAPVLLFLDGLDEVADISAREHLITTIGDSLTRWSNFDADLQVVVTSRPSVFGRAPSFGKYGFVTLKLQNIDEQRINEYAEKWVKARNLNSTEKSEVKKILSEKLELAHIRELTRNPMQLTILLSLIHQIGHSLPDQRTDLYSRYVDLFLTREADKSALVREHRVILLGFIQHLAWVLQTQAESSKTAGSITKTKLQELAHSYLEAGGQPVDIANDLFGGGLERIFVLVERIEGLYEFEVQPLREFYCAQYLYSTAHVGTYRDEVLRGDRAQRFEALAANPFWLNVCRFYAGSCERGETGTLVLSLEEMIRTGDRAKSIHARRVGLALLQDRVFSNVKYPQKQLITTVFEKEGALLLISGEGPNVEELALDIECGRDELRDLVYNYLHDIPTSRQATAFAICNILRLNGGSDLSKQFIGQLQTKKGNERSIGLARMIRSGAAVNISPQLMWELITKDSPSRDQILTRSYELLINEPDLAEKIQEVKECLIKGALDGVIKRNSFSVHPLALFVELLSSNLFTYRRMGGLAPILKNPADEGAILNDNKLDRSLINFFEEFSESAAIELDYRFKQQGFFEILDTVAESSRKNFGESWSSRSISIRAAGMIPRTEISNDVTNIFEETIPICSRARVARLRRGGTRWWMEQHNLAKGLLDSMFWVGLVIAWASTKNLYELSSRVNDIVDSLDQDQYKALKTTVMGVAGSRERRADRKNTTEVDLRPFSARAAVMVAAIYRADSTNLHSTLKQSRSEPLRSYLKGQQELEAVAKIPSGKDSSESLEWAEKVSSLRSQGFSLNYEIHENISKIYLTSDRYSDILSNPSNHMFELVNRASLEIQRSYRPEALATISKKQDWAFD